MKPYYESGGITIYHGDCREILPTLPKVDLVLTDPPYGCDWNTDYSRFSRGKKPKRKIRNDAEPFDPSFLLPLGECILFGENHFHGCLPSGSLLIWDKRTKKGFS